MPVVLGCLASVKVKLLWEMVSIRSFGRIAVEESSERVTPRTHGFLTKQNYVTSKYEI